MKEIDKSSMRPLLTAFFLAVVLIRASGQAAMPDILIRNNLKEQLDYLEERTKIYENYRAIREDMFQKVKKNITDTLYAANQHINSLEGTVSALEHTVDSLNSGLEVTKSRLEEAVNTKNSIRLLGIEVNKMAYNSIMWLIIITLAFILILGFLVFRKNLSVVHQTQKELNDLKDEFQSYRKTSREAREKMSMDHFNELKKLRGG